MTALAAPAAPRRRNRQESLAAFCAGLRFDDLSQAVVERLKGHPLFAHVTLTRSERSPIAALVTEMLEHVVV